MKKIKSLKVIELIVFAVLALAAIILLMLPDTKSYIFSNVGATLLFVLIWLILIAVFIFLLLDYSFIASTKLNYKTLYEAAYSDSTSGIPNRFSCDVLIEKYADKALPDTVGCVMIDLTNLPETNATYGHNSGNALIKQFSQLLSASAVSLCFVGRNGGNKFLAIFEDCTQDKIDSFTQRLTGKVEKHNQTPNAMPIEFKYGSALNKDAGLSQITQLIALANHHIYEED